MSRNCHVQASGLGVQGSCSSSSASKQVWPSGDSLVFRAGATDLQDLKFDAPDKYGAEKGGKRLKDAVPKMLVSTHGEPGDTGLMLWRVS